MVITVSSKTVIICCDNRDEIDVTNMSLDDVIKKLTDLAFTRKCDCVLHSYDEKSLSMVTFDVIPTRSGKAMTVPRPNILERVLGGPVDKQSHVYMTDDELSALAEWERIHSSLSEQGKGVWVRGYRGAAIGGHSLPPRDIITGLYEDLWDEGYAFYINSHL